jgi:hypothetical protein
MQQPSRPTFEARHSLKLLPQSRSLPSLDAFTTATCTGPASSPRAKCSPLPSADNSSQHCYGFGNRVGEYRL